MPIQPSTKQQTSYTDKFSKDPALIADLELGENTDKNIQPIDGKFIQSVNPQTSNTVPGTPTDRITSNKFPLSSREFPHTPEIPPIEIPPVEVPPSQDDTQSTSIYRNNQSYTFDVYYQDGSNLQSAQSTDALKQGAFKFDPLSIIQLVIEEDLLNWYSKGYVIIQHNFEGMETKAKQSIGTGNLVPTFRMDGRDIIYIHIKPQVENGTQSLEFEDKDWTLDYIFAVYDMEDLYSGNSAVKAKKLYIRDLRYQLMSELNIEFWTDGQMTTGQALSAILSIANMPYGLGKISQTLWDVGKDQIFYTSPSDYTVLDDIDYLLERHISTTNNYDFCLLTTDRFTKEFQLVPWSEIFLFAGKQSPGIYQIEHFFLQSYSGSDESGNPAITPIVPKAPLSQGQSTSVDTKLDKYGLIMQYKFVDMAGVDSGEAITNRPVYSYQHASKTFTCEYKDHNIIDTKDYFKSNYVDKLYGKSPSPMMTLNLAKKKFLNLETVYTTKETKEARLNDGRNKTLFAGIYLNETLSFTVQGSTNRKIGRFIGIDRHQIGETDNNFDNKFLGQWFTTNIKHVFNADNYLNEILAVKIHSYKDLGINEDIF